MLYSTKVSIEIQALAANIATLETTDSDMARKVSSDLALANLDRVRAYIVREAKHE